MQRSVNLQELCSLLQSVEMTVLGWVDLRKTKFAKLDVASNAGCDVFIFADGRISNGNNTLTDSAPKLHILDVCVHTSSKKELKSQIAFGFAGASALTALSAIGFVSHVLRHLRGEQLPSVEQISTFICSAFRAAIEEYSVNTLRATSSAIVMAGFDAEKNATVVKAIRLVWKESSYVIQEIQQDRYMTFASEPDGWDLFGRVDAILERESGTLSSAFVYNTICQVETSIREVAGSQPYGGQLQVCLINSSGPQLAATRAWDFSHRGADLDDDWSEGDYRTTLLGFDVFDLRVGQCDFVCQQIVPLPDTDKTEWAKNSIPSEPRQFDDNDFFSRPRAAVLMVPVPKVK